MPRKWRATHLTHRSQWESQEIQVPHSFPHMGWQAQRRGIPSGRRGSHLPGVEGLELLNLHAKTC